MGISPSRRSRRGVRDLDSEVAANASLFGYTGFGKTHLSTILKALSLPISDIGIDSLFDLPSNRRKQGSLFDPSASGAAMVFRALLPGLTPEDIARVLKCLKSYPKREAASPRATTPWGERMVLAHELCHLLIDRHQARPLKILSGPWAPPLLERRANAFAAELLLPTAALRAALKGSTHPPMTTWSES